MIHNIHKIVEEYTAAPTKLLIQLLKMLSNAEQQLAEDKLMYIHHILCNLILLSLPFTS
uniref:Uncharacterized protein n=1 Tax=Arundo donax TaxID=35708 RepID=A0A0A9GDC6_ARUDO